MHPNVNAQEDDFQVDPIHWSKSYSSHEAKVARLL